MRREQNKQELPHPPGVSRSLLRWSKACPSNKDGKCSRLEIHAFDRALPQITLGLLDVEGPCLTFWCPGCKTQKPWCHGQADDTPHLCDTCAVGGKE